MDRWQDQAACGNTKNPDDFYSEQGLLKKKLARKYCAPCPVRDKCLADIMAYERGKNLHMRFGFVAGTTPSMRIRYALGEPIEGMSIL